MKKEQQKKAYKADYRGASPEDVALALLKFRPKTKGEKNKNEHGSHCAGGC